MCEQCSLLRMSTTWLINTLKHWRRVNMLKSMYDCCELVCVCVGVGVGVGVGVCMCVCGCEKMYCVYYV